nr:hypothetical protein [uncultured Draconibacterium sp.]
MNKLRIGLIVVASAVIITELIIIDYDNFLGSKNIANYSVVVGMVALIISLILGIKSERKKPKE